MKRFVTLTGIALVASIIGSIVGYNIAVHHETSSDREYYLLHEGLDRQARVYLRFLQAEDSGDPEQMTQLRRQALATLQVYVQEVADMRDLGFEWAPFDDQMYASAHDYLNASPGRK